MPRRALPAVVKQPVKVERNDLQDAELSRVFSGRDGRHIALMAWAETP